MINLEEKVVCENCQVIYANHNGVQIMLFEEALKIDGSSLNEYRNPEKEYVKKHFTIVAESLESTGVARFVSFLNYGYVPNENPTFARIKPEAGEFSENQLRLLFELIGDCNINGKNIIDIGCGRGGNIRALSKYFQPHQLVGLDLTEASIQFCKSKHKIPNATFLVGDAENVPFQVNSFDVVINVESSSAYDNIYRFYDSVYRVLKPGGDFLYTDVFNYSNVSDYEQYLEQLGFTIVRSQDITSNIMLSCDQVAGTHFSAYGELNDDETHRLKNSIAVPGSLQYEAMKNGSKVFRLYHLKKLQVK